MPLGKLLADLKLSHINFFSLDVEGAELSVLEVREHRPCPSCTDPGTDSSTPALAWVSHLRWPYVTLDQGPNVTINWKPIPIQMSTQP